MRWRGRRSDENNNKILLRRYSTRTCAVHVCTRTTLYRCTRTCAVTRCTEVNKIILSYNNSRLALCGGGVAEVHVFIHVYIQYSSIFCTSGNRYESTFVLPYFVLIYVTHTCTTTGYVYTTWHQLYVHVISYGSTTYIFPDLQGIFIYSRTFFPIVHLHYTYCTYVKTTLFYKTIKLHIPTLYNSPTTLYTYVYGNRIPSKISAGTARHVPSQRSGGRPPPPPPPPPPIASSCEALRQLRTHDVPTTRPRGDARGARIHARMTSPATSFDSLVRLASPRHAAATAARRRRRRGREWRRWPKNFHVSCS